MNTITGFDEREQPLTAGWLKDNTRIHGWFAFFMFAMAIGGLLSIVYPIATYKASDYYGSTLLGMTDVATGVVMAVVAAWAIRSLCKRSPTAIFWAKYYTLLVLSFNGLGLWIGGEQQGEIRMMSRGAVWAIIWFLYLTCSKQVQTVIPKCYRHVGVRTWFCAGLLLLCPLIFGCAGLVDLVVGYQGKSEIRQSELSDGELTDGHVVFDQLDGWLFGATRTDGVNVCSFTNSQGLVMTLLSVLDSDSSLDNFKQIFASAANEDFENLVHQTVRDDRDSVDGQVRYYRIVRYDRDDAIPIFWHFACLFDEVTSKAVVVNGYFFSEDVPDFTRVLKSVRFRK